MDFDFDMFIVLIVVGWVGQRWRRL